MKPDNSLRRWKILTAATSSIAAIVTVVLIWYVATNKTTEKDNKQLTTCDTNTQKAVTVACPQLPTLFPLAKPTPKKITDVFKEIESVLKSFVEEKSSLPAISMNVFLPRRHPVERPFWKQGVSTTGYETQW